MTDIIKHRRTNKKFDGQKISFHRIKELLEIAMHAPNHRKNEPWNFTIINQEDLSDLFNNLLKLHPTLIGKKKEKLNLLFSNAGALVITTYQKNSIALVEKENYAATCCAIQNFLLLCEESSISTFWSTNSLFLKDSFLQLLGISSSEEEVSAVLFIGTSSTTPQKPNYDFKSKIHNWPKHLSQ